MKAWLLLGPEQLALRDLPGPEPGQDEALVRVGAVGICGSDLEAFAGTHPQPAYPRVLGHEFAGEVVTTGSGWVGVPVGTRVAVDPARSCAQCYACRKGRHNCCAQLSIAGVHRPGALAEHAVCRSEQLTAIPDAMDFPTAAAVETLGIGAQAIRRTQVEHGDRVVVLGAGPVGLCGLMMARLQGAEALVVEPLEWRRALAAELGASAQADPSVDPAERAVQSFTDGYGAHVVIDATGNVEAAGRVLILTLSAKPIQVQPWQLTRQELTVLGSQVSLAHFGDLISLVSSGRASVDGLITHRYAIDQAEAGFRAAHARGSPMVKAVVFPC